MNNRKNNIGSLEAACSKIAPLWPLKDYVAVNPFLGMSGNRFSEAAHVLQQRADITVTMPVSYYMDRINQSKILDEDIASALKKYGRSISVGDFIEELKSSKKSTSKIKLKTVGDVIQSNFKIEVNEVMIDCITKWAASHFDNDQAIWSSDNDSKNLYDNWKRDAKIDRTPEVYGLKGFRRYISELPEDEVELLDFIMDTLGIENHVAEAYIHTLLLRTIGWSGFIAGRDWHNRVYGAPTNYLHQYALILLSWEYGVYRSTESGSLRSQWSYFRSQYAEETCMNSELMNRLILQESFDISKQRKLVTTLSSSTDTNDVKRRPEAQAVFCIDVRSEVYRRNLEAVNPEIETIGFAGFFGFPVKLKMIGATEVEHQCPVLIPSGPKVSEKYQNDDLHSKAITSTRTNNYLFKGWKNFRSGLTSSYSFVSPLGVYYLPKLLFKSTSNTKKELKSKWVGKKEIDLSEISIEQQVEMAANALTLMGLNENLAKWVLITGHGSTSSNNPHAAGLDCGACGGHSGEVNAIVAAQVLNDTKVRVGLVEKGIEIPNDTVFIAALHDTTTDQVIINTPLSDLESEGFAMIQDSLSLASKNTRQERAQRFDKVLNGDELISRAFDWSQVRPEWGLAGCDSFIVAPRSRTKGIDLEGRSFLHNYNWENDPEFKILELIMTAPMVVTSWINLQYYGSVTDTDHFGAGNKTIHNVTAGIGVLEGKGGDLRAGLALQSVSDGQKFQHQPVRLNVVIEAPKNAINEILLKHDGVRELVDNEWISLFIMDEEGKVSEKYKGELNWESTIEKIPHRTLQTI